MHILSYDVASKSLAVSILYYNDKWKTEIQDLQKQFYDEVKTKKKSLNICRCVLKYLTKINKILKNIIFPIFLDVVDLVPNQKVKETTVILRSARLKSYLNFMDSYIKNLHITDSIPVLLEYQMGPNDKSRNVGSQLLYHYSALDFGYKSSTTETTTPDGAQESKNEAKCIYSVEIVGPTLKNKINLDKPYSFYAAKYVKAYDANKAHSRDNFIYWMKYIDKTDMYKSIKKKNIDDIADSVNMTLAWVFIKGKK